MSKKLWLVAAVFAATSVCGQAVLATNIVDSNGQQNSEGDKTILPYSVVVEAQKDRALLGNMVNEVGSVGLLGNKKVSDVPFSVTVVNEDAMALFSAPTLPLDKVLINNPAIRSAGSTLHNDFTYRGFRNNGTTALVNGVPGLMTQFNAPTYMMEKVTLIDGPNIGLSSSAVQYESSQAGGTLLYDTKKAGNIPNRSVKIVFTPASNLGTYVDVGERFGKNKKWGLRVNAQYQKGETSINKEEDNAASIYTNIDYRGENSLANLFIGTVDREIKNGVRWFKLGKNVTELPTVPDSSTNYGFDGMYKSSYGTVVAFNYEHFFSNKWEGFINAGYNRNNLDD